MKDREVKKIINYKVDEGKRYFEVIWKSSWEGEEALRSIAEDLVEEFLRCGKSSDDTSNKSITNDDQDAESIDNEQSSELNGSSQNDKPHSPSDTITNGSSPKPKKTRKGGINSIISRLQKTQQEGLLKQYDGPMSTDTAETKTYRPSSPLEGSLPRDGPEAALPSPTTGSAAYISNDSDQEQHMRGGAYPMHRPMGANHPINNIFKCAICSEDFYEETKFKQHMFMHDQVNILKQDAPKLLKPGTYECKFCHVILHDKDKLKVHYSEEHEKEFVHTQPMDQLYQCNLCEQSFVDYNKLLQHHQTHQQGRREVFILPKKSQASDSDASSSSPSGSLTLVHHHAEKKRANENSTDPHEPIEKYKNNLKSEFEETFDEETETVQPVTDEMLMKKDGAQRSEVVSTEYGVKKMYRCNLCDEMFETEDDRAKHSLVHVNRSSSLDCHICGKQFRHRTNLSTHLIVHSGVKPHQCHICLRRFTQKVNLQRHMHIHDGSRPFTCRMCSKSFTQKANLQRHILSHTEHSKEELLIALNEIPNESEVNNAINESLTEAMSVVMEQKPQFENHHEQKAEYQCEVCNKTFKQNVQLQKHMLTHSGSRPFQCYVCGKSFRQRASLQKHYSVHNNGTNSFVCQTCNRLFVSQTNLQRHMLVHAAPGENQCYLCDQKFNTTDNLERHFSEHIEEATPNMALPLKYFEQSTPGQTFRCATCDIVFDSPMVFSQHLQCHQKAFPPDVVPNEAAMEQQQQPVQMQCSACGLVFPSLAKLEAHMIMHTSEEMSKNGEKFVPIAISSAHHAAFASLPNEQAQFFVRTSASSHQPVAQTLLIPVTSHAPIVTVKQEESPPKTNGTHAPRVSRCPVCKEMFPSKAEMRSHYSVAHLETSKLNDSPVEPIHMPASDEIPMGPLPDDDDGIDDDGIDDEPDDPNNIQAGIISESEERLIKENEEFIKDNILGGPAEYESKGRYERGNYSCKICNRVLTYKYSLEKHMLLHTGSFPYKCHLCSKRFNHKANYDKHLIVHRGDKPYSCHICARPFSQKSNLQRHQLTHTQNRDFICDVCGKRFNHMASLKTHSLIHTGAKPFSCYICTKRFNQKGNLKRHIQTHRTGKRNKITGLEEDADIDDMLKDEIDQMDEMGEMRDMGDMDENEHMERMERMERMEGRVKPEQIKSEYMEKESASMVMQNDDKFYMMAAKVEHELSQMENQGGEYYKTKEIKMEKTATPSRRSQRPRQKKHMDDFEFLDDDEPLPTMISGEQDENTSKQNNNSNNGVPAYPATYEGGEQILTVMPSDAVYPEETEKKEFTTPPKKQPATDSADRKETFHCGQCSKLFISLASLEAHKRHAHSFIMCDICGRPFSQKANLLKHKLIHANKKPFSCKICNKAFRQKANLQRHELIHDKDRKTVNCTECNKSFRCAWSLKQHMKNHNSSGGAFGCSICGKTFKGKDRLMQHFSIHNQLGAFTCHLCDMKFQSPEHLRKHLETHGTYPTPLPLEEGSVTMVVEPSDSSMGDDNLVIVTNPMENDIDSETPTVEIVKNEMLNGSQPSEIAT